jgi:single-strand DNA-binding protein
VRRLGHHLPTLHNLRTDNDKGNNMSAAVTLTGRLGSDPEIKFSKDGKAIANLRVATNKRRRLDSGEWEDIDTTWWRVTAFGALAENIADALSKGDAIIVVGNIKQRDWEDTNTREKRSAMEVIANQAGPDLSRVKAKPKAATGDPWAAAPAQSSDIPF